MATEPELVGGWYPLFFQSYDQHKVNLIIQDNTAKRIVVLYDKNKDLADKIIANIQSKTKITIERSQKVPKDDKTTQYNHDQVVVTVYQR